MKANVNTSENGVPASAWRRTAFALSLLAFAFASIYGFWVGDVTNPEASQLDWLRDQMGIETTVTSVRCGTAIVIALLVCPAVAAIWRRLESLDMDVIRRSRSPSLADWLLAAVIGGAIVASIWRIATVHFYMERVQAFLIASIVAGWIGWRLRTASLSVRIFLPLALMAVAAKLLYVHALVPERDQWRSTRPIANAIAATLPADAELFAERSPGSAFCYYLRRPVQPLGHCPQAETFKRRFVVSFDSQPNIDISGEWRFVPAGRFVGAGGVHATLTEAIAVK